MASLNPGLLLKENMLFILLSGHFSLSVEVPL